MTAQTHLVQAVKLLSNEGVQLIEWGDQVMKSFGYPAVPIVYNFIVPDASMHPASELLEKAGYPKCQPSIGLQVLGTFGTAGVLHALFENLDESRIRMQLLPESLVHLDERDVEPVLSFVDPGVLAFRPRLPEYCVSLLKCQDDYAVGTQDRSLPDSHLSILLAIGAYKQGSFDKFWTSEEETASEEQFRARRSAAADEIESWPLRQDDTTYRSKLKAAL